MRAGLGSVGYGKDATEEALYATVDKINSTLQTRINYLSVIGVCAPMIGLLGTVGGMKGAFGSLGTAGLSGGVGELAGHIGEVLVATASGLFVAIPAFMAFYFLRNKLQGAVHHLQEDGRAPVPQRALRLPQGRGRRPGGNLRRPAQLGPGSRRAEPSDPIFTNNLLIN